MKYLLGINNDNDLMFAEPELKSNSGFTCSFDVVRPFVVDDEELDELAQTMFDELDAETKLSICTRLNCPPNNVGIEMDRDEKIEMVYDTSLYPNTIYASDGDEWMFDAVGCGQCDIRTDGIKHLVVSDECFNTLIYLWDNYHLKKLPRSEENKFYSMIDELELLKCSEETEIRNMIDKYIIGRGLQL